MDLRSAGEGWELSDLLWLQGGAAGDFTPAQTNSCLQNVRGTSDSLLHLQMENKTPFALHSLGNYDCRSKTGKIQRKKKFMSNWRLIICWSWLEDLPAFSSLLSWLLFFCFAQPNSFRWILNAVVSMFLKSSLLTHRKSKNILMKSLLPFISH